MRRAMIVKDRKGIKCKGLTGWIKPVGTPVGWNSPLYAFYVDGQDKCLPIREKEFRYLSDAER